MVQTVKKELEACFNVPSKIVENAVKINVKQIDPDAFRMLTHVGRNSFVNIKRSGAGITIIVTPH